MQPDTLHRIFGGSLAAGGSFLALVQDHMAGFTVTGLTAGMIAVSGAGVLIYGNVKNSRREQRRKDAEAELEIEAKRHRARMEFEGEIRSSLSGRLEMVTVKLNEMMAEHKADMEVAKRHQDELKTALDLSNENYQRLRKSLHEARNQLQALTDERTSLQHQLNDARLQVEKANARLAKLGVTAERTQQAAGRIEEQTGQIAHAVTKMSDSQHELSTDLAPTPDPDATPPR